MIDDSGSLDAILRGLTDPELASALRRESGAEVQRITMERLTPGPVRSWLLGHAAELTGDAAQALAHYDHAAAAQNHVALWSRLAGHVIRARLATPDFDEAAARNCVASALELAHVRPQLLPDVAIARARIAIDRPPASVRAVDVLEALASLEQASVHATGVIRETCGWERITTAERFSPLYMQVFRALACGEQMGCVPRAGARAWSWFRDLWQDHDLLPGAKRCAPLPRHVPQAAVVLEWLAVPGAALQVCWTDTATSLTGTYEGEARHAARLQLELGDRLRVICEHPDSSTRMLELCQWTWLGAAEWSALLLETPITWSDATCSTLQARLAAAAPAHVFILPHGPTQMVPWSLLRTGDAPAWITSWRITVCPSWRASVPCAADGDHVILQLPVEQFHLPPIEAGGPARSLFTALSGATRAWIIGHGAFVPMTHGESRLTTARHSQQLWSNLRDLVADADAAIEAQLPVPRSVVLSICEAAEVSRRAYLSEGQTLARTFLIAGASEVLAAKWQITDASEPALEALIASPAAFSDAAHAMLRDAYTRWLDCHYGDIPTVAFGCVDRRQMLLCDLGAFDLHGYIEPGDPHGHD